MVAKTTDISRAKVSAEGLLAPMGLVVRQQEVRMKDAGTTLLVAKTILGIH